MARYDWKFWRHVDYGDRTRDTCWRWTGSTLPSGYGQVKRNGTTVMAHRYAYMQFFGPVRRDERIRHTKDCRSRACCNPYHLYSERQNVPPVLPEETMMQFAVESQTDGSVDRYLSVYEMASILGFGVGKTRRLVQGSSMPTLQVTANGKPGGSIRVRKSVFYDWLDHHEK